MIIKEIFSKLKDNSRTNCTFLQFQEFSRTKVIFKDFSRSVRTLVMEQTRKVNAQTDIRTDGGHDIIRPVLDGRIKGNAPLQNCQNFGSASR